MPTTTATADLDTNITTTGDGVAAHGGGGALAKLAAYKSPHRPKAEIRKLGLASTANRVRVLAAIGVALRDLGDTPVIINLHGACALPVAVDADDATAGDRVYGPVGGRWNLAVVNADDDRYVIKQKYPPRTVIVAVSREPIEHADIRVACN